MTPITMKTTDTMARNILSDSVFHGLWNKKYPIILYAKNTKLEIQWKVIAEERLYL